MNLLYHRGQNRSHNYLSAVWNVGDIRQKGTGINSDGDNTFSTTIVNRSGSELPSTGGIGTTIFYIVGAILVIGAGVVLVTRRRVNNEE